MIRVMVAVLRREWTLAARIGAGVELGMVFFLILIALVPFALGPDQKLLSRLAPALLWIAALLSVLLGLDRLLQADDEDGVLDQMLLSAVPLELILFVKALATDRYRIAPRDPCTLVRTDAGDPARSHGAAGVVTPDRDTGAHFRGPCRRSAHRIAATRRSASPCWSLPLTVPTLIFGVSVVREAAEGRAFATPLALLAATTLIASVVSPVAAAAALRLTRS